MYKEKMYVEILPKWLIFKTVFFFFKSTYIVVGWEAQRLVMWYTVIFNLFTLYILQNTYVTKRTIYNTVLKLTYTCDLFLLIFNRLNVCIPQVVILIRFTYCHSLYLFSTNRENFVVHQSNIRYSKIFTLFIGD